MEYIRDTAINKGIHDGKFIKRHIFFKIQIDKYNTVKKSLSYKLMKTRYLNC